MLLVCITLLFKYVLVNRWIFTKENYYKLTEIYKKYFWRHGIEFVGIYHCPHAPKKIEDKVCFCRKPNPGIILRAVQDHQIELYDSIMVGDKITDMIAAKNAGIYNKFFVKRKFRIN